MRRAPLRLLVRAALITVLDLDDNRASSSCAGSPRHPRQSHGRERLGIAHGLTQLPGNQQLSLLPSGHLGHHAQIVGTTRRTGETIFRGRRPALPQQVLPGERCGTAGQPLVPL